ncbi:Rhomboid protease GluP [Clostridium liquoris]|jgi:rhomboid protease GluP|uniref:Rhomboid protease GluP n=1 Tax=Clostridium liquoris TaxID=1289519 RepID=A0A2T0B0N9_9CLOT|nr:rhomboid family intramembrane serine protease [Clostridium liquoris]PRR77144.1 Rhomboid protease GluP [Clostridium liquoris]
MDTKENIIKFIIENATRGLGYTLLELNNSYNGIVSPWVMIRQEGDGRCRGVIFCNEEYENKNDYYIKLAINNYNNAPNLILTKIVFTDNKEKTNMIIENIIHEPSPNNLHMGEYIFLDADFNKILYYTSTSGSEELVNIISYFINEVAGKKESTVRKKDIPSLTYVIIGINVFMYLITAVLSGNIMESNINVLIFLGAKVNQLIAKGEYYRLITCAFLHGGIVHLGLNMYSLYALGPLIEKVYGKWKYGLIYFISCITSSLLSYFLSDSISIGASGAIFGLLGACLVIALKLKDQVGKSFVSNIISVIFVNLLIGFSVANVDNFGHLGGLIGGTIIGALIWEK